VLSEWTLGRIAGRQALGVRATDTAIHTWDLARAIGADERLDADLIAWIDGNLAEFYAGLPETPAAADDAPVLRPSRRGAGR
jgi:hypothetical protein